jgi:MFS family permease
MDPELSGERTPDSAAMHASLGWLTVLAAFGYAIYGYYGFAPPPGGMPTDWWHGRTFILDYETMGGYVDAPIAGTIVFGIPAFAVFLATLFTTRSAIARLLSLSFSLTAILFAAAGFAAGPLWVLFSWRFSAVAFLTGLSLAAAVLSPVLIASWLRIGVTKRLVIYAPIFFGVMASVRGATGTSEHMTFMMSPWPLWTTYGLEAGVMTAAILLFSIAFGVLWISRGRVDAVAALGLILAISLPGAWALFGDSELPTQWALQASLIAACVIAACSIHRGETDRTAELLRRSYHIGLGAVLVAVPVFAGRSLATGDYALNRYIRAPGVIEALQQHIKSEEFYPETLEGLVEAGYFDHSPKPRIGFGWLELIGLSDEVKFRYNEYGSSFVLEFDSRFWVQCSYSGNYYFDDEEEEFDEEDQEYADEEPEWTCLDKRPALIEEESYDEEYDEEFEEEYDDE